MGIKYYKNEPRYYRATSKECAMLLQNDFIHNLIIVMVKMD
jgi:hypothetical protein